MSLDSDQLQLVLLRILGVLLIVVGVAVIARNAASHDHRKGGIASLVDRLSLHDHRCETVRVEMRSFDVATPPAPPAPPRPRF